MSPLSRDRRDGHRRRDIMPTRKHRPKKDGQKPCKGKVRFPSLEFAETHAAALRDGLIMVNETVERRETIHAYLCRHCSIGGRPIFHVGHRRLRWDHIPFEPEPGKES